MSEGQTTEQKTEQATESMPEKIRKTIHGLSDRMAQMEKKGKKIEKKRRKRELQKWWRVASAYSCRMAEVGMRIPRHHLEQIRAGHVLHLLSHPCPNLIPGVIFMELEWMIGLYKEPGINALLVQIQNVLLEQKFKEVPDLYRRLYTRVIAVEQTGTTGVPLDEILKAEPKAAEATTRERVSGLHPKTALANSLGAVAKRLSRMDPLKPGQIQLEVNEMLNVTKSWLVGPDDREFQELVLKFERSIREYEWQAARGHFVDLVRALNARNRLDGDQVVYLTGRCRRAWKDDISPQMLVEEVVVLLVGCAGLSKDAFVGHARRIGELTGMLERRVQHSALEAGNKRLCEALRDAMWLETGSRMSALASASHVAHDCVTFLQHQGLLGDDDCLRLCARLAAFREELTQLAGRPAKEEAKEETSQEQKEKKEQTIDQLVNPLLRANSLLGLLVRSSGPATLSDAYVASLKQSIQTLREMTGLDYRPVFDELDSALSGERWNVALQNLKALAKWLFDDDRIPVVAYNVIEMQHNLFAPMLRPNGGSLPEPDNRFFDVLGRLGLQIVVVEPQSDDEARERSAVAQSVMREIDPLVQAQGGAALRTEWKALGQEVVTQNWHNARRHFQRMVDQMVGCGQLTDSERIRLKTVIATEQGTNATTDA